MVRGAALSIPEAMQSDKDNSLWREPSVSSDGATFCFIYLRGNPSARVLGLKFLPVSPTADKTMGTQNELNIALKIIF